MIKSKKFARKDNRILTGIIWGGFLLVLFGLAYKFPIVGDDWYATRVHIKSLEELIENGANHWNNVNGRWLGHIAVIMSMQYKPVCAVVRAAIICLIMVFAYKNSGFKAKEGYLIIFLYILAIPKEIFSETYSWAAGFFNYVPPVLLILIYLYLIKNEFKQKAEKYLIFRVCFSFLIGMCSQLFVENITVYVVIFSVVVTISYFIRFKRISMTALAHTLGSIAGTFIMFLSPVYRTVAEGTDTYRTAPQGITGMIQTIRGNWSEISKYSVRGNVLLIFTVSAVCIYLLYRENAQVKRLVRLRTINSCVIAGATAYFLSSIFLKWDEKIELYTAFFCLDVFIILLFAISVLTTIIFFVQNEEKKRTCLFYLFSAFVLVGPLLIVTPIGPRCFYGSYIFTVIAFLNIMSYIIDREQWELKKVFPAFCVLSFCVTVYYMYIFSNISEVEKERDVYISEQMQKGASVIVLPEFPYSDYLHEPHGWKIGLKYYYEKMGDIEFDYVPYSDWKSITS